MNKGSKEYLSQFFTPDKLKQGVALFGGFLSALFFFLKGIGITFSWFNEETIDLFSSVLINAVPFILLIYGVYKNSYIMTEKAKKQEEALKQKGLK